jgi:predicted CoA-binding protein
VENAEAAAVAEKAGIPVIMDRCIYQEWLRLLNA